MPAYCEAARHCAPIVWAACAWPGSERRRQGIARPSRRRRSLRSGRAWPSFPGIKRRVQCRLRAYPSHPLPVVAISITGPAAPPPAAMSPLIAMVRWSRYSYRIPAAVWGPSKPPDPSAPRAHCQIVRCRHHITAPCPAQAVRPSPKRYALRARANVIRHGKNNVCDLGLTPE